MKYELHNGPNQYGRRKGTLGLALHMTEGNGGDGDLAYLLRNPARGVSANFFAHEDGTIHQLMPIGQTSGSMNPADRAKPDKGYYGSDVLKAVLGTHWTDPNAYSISIEIGGKRADGPNDAQVAACIAWGRDMRDRYPSLAGAYGHADQTDTKGCPGTTAAMKAIFAGIGGHGPFTEDDVRNISGRPGPSGTFTVKQPNIGYHYLDLETNKTDPATFTTPRRALPVTINPPLAGGAPGANRKDGYLWAGSSAKFMLASDVDFVPDPEPVDCSALEQELATANGRIQRAITDLGGVPA